MSLLKKDLCEGTERNMTARENESGVHACVCVDSLYVHTPFQHEQHVYPWEMCAFIWKIYDISSLNLGYVITHS